MISGSWPPAVCGVGDNTHTLVEALTARGAQIDCVRFDDWSWPRRNDIAAHVRSLGADVVHIQYPTHGYGNSLVPNWLAWRLRDMRVAVTLHEFTALLPSGRLRALATTVRMFSAYAFSHALVFSNENECRAYCRIAPWVRPRSHVVPIGSAIPDRTTAEDRACRIVHFGQIVPGKGLEDYVELAELLQADQSPCRVWLIGAVPRTGQSYAGATLARLRAAGTELLLDAAPETVAHALATSALAYLPFPNGASEKRSSLLAALANGTIVITRHSHLTPDWIRSCTLDASTPIDAFALVRDLLASPARMAALRARTLASRDRFGWDAIAERHLEIYRGMVSGAPR
jgi:glycosyltransferase involved in cell wall biosynthesis